jgi:hypothetical protein
LGEAWIKMAQKGKRSESGGDDRVRAVQDVYNALEPLPAEERERVIASVQALFGVSTPSLKATIASGTGPSGAPSDVGARRAGLSEVIQEKRPKTNIDYIALFSYYRDIHERAPRFTRNDLRPYFGKAHLSPPANYDRDFVEAVKRGWLHEDGSDSYITSRGIEAVESGFPTERKPKETRSRSARRRTPLKKKTPRKGR